MSVHGDDIKVLVVDYGRKYLQLQYIDPVTKKRVSRSSKTSDRRKAEKLAVEWQTELKHGLYKSPSKLTWVEFRERYDNEYLSVELRESSATRVRTTFNFIEETMHPQTMSQITSQWVTRFKQVASKDRSTETANVDLRNLKAALRWAKDQHMVTEVPVIKQFRRSRSQKMKGRPVTEAEFDLMLEVTPKVPSIGDRYASAWQRFLRGLWWSGLRLDEAVNLTWDEWAQGIRVRVSEDRYVFLMISSEDEKGGKDRVYPVAPEFAEMLLEAPEDDRQGYVFDLPQKNGRATVSTEVGRKVSAIGKKAGVKVSEGARGVKYASAHDLRRSFGFRWSRRIFPAELMELMRHESIETTMTYYVGQQAELTAKKLYEALEREKANLPS